MNVNMKILSKISLVALITIFGAACEEGIDDINAVAPGPDEQAPVVTVTYPFEGAQIRVREDVAPVVIKLEATDDIEVQSVVLTLDGTQIAELSGFKDYRRALEEFQYDNLVNGDHVLTVTANDLSGKSTSTIVNFQKVPPYQPKYPGEILYIPFDGDYFELLSITEATPAGGPVFVNGIAGQAVSLDAKNLAYVTFPGDAMATVSNFSVSFWVNPDFVDANGDGGIDGILGLVNLSNSTGFWGNLDWFIENGSTPAVTKMVVHSTNSAVDPPDAWITDLNNLSGFFGAWSNHVVTYNDDAHEFKYYINGALKLTKPAVWSDDLVFENTGQMVFGAVHFMTNPSSTTGSGAQPWASYLTGELDEIRIFDRTLTDADVKLIYDDVM
jgi:hypothetical protein